MAVVNGINYSASSLTVILPVIGPLPVVMEINYNRVQKIDDNYALGAEPVSRGYGQVTYTGDITMYKDAWNLIAAGSPGKDPLKLPPFPITLVFVGGIGIPYRKEVLAFCNFKNNPFGTKGGDTKMTCKIDLAIGGIE